LLFKGNNYREVEMRLAFSRFDGRTECWIDVIDKDTGKKIGFIHPYGVGAYGGGIQVSLLHGKYTAHLNRYEECAGFVKGVEAVLNHMVSMQDQSSEKAA
jgi:hypothetical protein